MKKTDKKITTEISSLNYTEKTMLDFLILCFPTDATQMLLRGMRGKPIEISQESLGSSRVLNDAQDFDHPQGFKRLE